jgi:hypothetical protein
MNRQRAEGAVQIGILILIGAMAGAASFTHVHDWTMANSPAGTGDWFGWANAVISELTPTAAGLEIRRRKRTGQHIGYPMAVLAAAATVSIAAQIAQAKPGATGYLLAALPALAFLALSKLALSRTPGDSIRTVVADETAAVHVTAERPAIENHHTPDHDTAVIGDQIQAGLLTGARMAAHVHHTKTGQPITAAGLAEHLGTTETAAAQLLHQLDDAPATDTSTTGGRP